MQRPGPGVPRILRYRYCYFRHEQRYCDHRQRLPGGLRLRCPGLKYRQRRGPLYRQCFPKRVVVGTKERGVVEEIVSSWRSFSVRLAYRRRPASNRVSSQRVTLPFYLEDGKRALQAVRAASSSLLQGKVEKIYEQCAQHAGCSLQGRHDIGREGSRPRPGPGRCS